jgi:uncharacterized protein (DUF3820 family)
MAKVSEGGFAVDVRLRFGKYRGQYLDEVTDCSYLAWLAEQPWLAPGLAAAVAEVLRDCRWRMPFGRWKGQYLDELPHDYLSWLANYCHFRQDALREAVEAELARR